MGWEGMMRVMKMSGAISSMKANRCLREIKFLGASCLALCQIKEALRLSSTGGALFFVVWGQCLQTLWCLRQIFDDKFEL